MPGGDEVFALNRKFPVRYSTRVSSPRAAGDIWRWAIARLPRFSTRKRRVRSTPGAPRPRSWSLMLMQSVEASEEAAGLYRHAIETASYHGTPAFALRAALALPRLLDGKRRG